MDDNKNINANQIFEILDKNESIVLMNEYKKLNEKCDKIINRIKNRKQNKEENKNG